MGLLLSKADQHVLALVVVEEEVAGGSSSTTAAVALSRKDKK